MTSILVTGSKGQVGCELQFLAKNYPNFSFVFTDYEELDITDATAVMQAFETHQFDYCINCAAYTAVDKAESDAEKARQINVVGVEHLAAACEKTGAQLLQLSTDYVYHNSQNTPFKEDDITNPQSVYASTKLAGDEAALAKGGMVIRTSWVYSSHGHNFVKTMLRLGAERDKLTIIFDQIGTPTYARPLAGAMLRIIQKAEQNTSMKARMAGIYHYSNEGVTSWYDFAMAIFEIRNINVNVLPIETKDYPTPAKRPPFSVLNKGKIKEAFDITIPYWKDSLKKCLEMLEA